jgi:hypothetical protein
MFRAVTLVFAVAVLSAAPMSASAHLIGYDCAVESRLPDHGFAHVSRFFWPDLARPPQTRMTWWLRRPYFDAEHLSGIELRFAPPAAGSTTPQLAELQVDYVVRGVPKPPLWLAARMGGASSEITLYLPPPYRFDRCRPGECGGVMGSAVLKGAALRQAFAEGRPLEVYVLGADGAVVQQYVEPLADRDQALDLLRANWAEALRLSADPPKLCRQESIEE